MLAIENLFLHASVLDCHSAIKLSEGRLNDHVFFHCNIITYIDHVVKSL